MHLVLFLIQFVIFALSRSLNSFSLNEIRQSLLLKQCKFRVYIYYEKFRNFGTFYSPRNCE